MKANQNYTDYKNIFKAIGGDKVAHDSIELKYGRMKTIEDLYDLATILYDGLSKEEKKMSFAQADLSLRMIQEILTHN